MITGYEEGYIESINEHSVRVPSAVTALLFIELCQGIDIARNQSYRYSYVPKKQRNNEYLITIQDQGV